jgi:hypothetical protein
MPVPESRHEQIAAALMATLAAIVADTSNYWYTPSQVQRTVVFEDAWLDSSLDYIILIRPGEERHLEEANKTIDGFMEIYLLVLKQHRPSTENPYTEEAPTRWTVVDRCTRDILKKLLADVTLGGLAVNLFSEGVIVDRERFIEGWATQETRFSIQYRYRFAAP